MIMAGSQVAYFLANILKQFKWLLNFKRLIFVVILILLDAVKLRYRDASESEMRKVVGTKLRNAPNALKRKC